jgi:anaerobic magnesium-protoporphyrin IX monomethyl ester cyclase
MGRRKKVLFITPPYHCGVVEVAGRWMPLTFAYLAGSLREEGFEPVIYDAMTKRHGFQEIEERIVEESPDYVATTAITSTAFDAYEILRIAKDVNPGIITLIGGVHPTFMFSEALHIGYCDYVIRGEGELTLRDLLLTIEGGGMPSDVRGIAFKHGHRIITTPPRCFINGHWLRHSIHPY